MLTYADLWMQHEVFRLLRAMEDLHGLPYSKLALSARQLSGEKLVYAALSSSLLYEALS